MITISPSDAATAKQWTTLKSLLNGYAVLYGVDIALSGGSSLDDVHDFASWQKVLADLQGRFSGRWQGFLDGAFTSAGVGPADCGGFPPADVYALGRCAAVWANFVHAASTFSLTVDAPPSGGGERVLVNNPPGTVEKPWWKSWKAWVGIGAGVSALVGGALAIRKTRGHPRPAMAEGLDSPDEVHRERRQANLVTSSIAAARSQKALDRGDCRGAFDEAVEASMTARAAIAHDASLEHAHLDPSVADAVYEAMVARTRVRDACLRGAK